MKKSGEHSAFRVTMATEQDAERYVKPETLTLSVSHVSSHSLNMGNEALISFLTTQVPPVGLGGLSLNSIALN